MAPKAPPPTYVGTDYICVNNGAPPCRTEAQPGAVGLRRPQHGRLDWRRWTAGPVAREVGRQRARPLGRVHGLVIPTPGGHIANKEAWNIDQVHAPATYDARLAVGTSGAAQIGGSPGTRSERPASRQATGEGALDRGFSVGHKRGCKSTCFS
jgi:hypothetical protein